MPNNRRRTLRKNNRRGTLRKNNRRRQTKRRQTKRRRIRKNMKGGMEGWAGVSFPDMFSLPSLGYGTEPAPDPAPARVRVLPAPLEAATKAVADAEARVVELTEMLEKADEICIIVQEVRGGHGSQKLIDANKRAAHAKRDEVAKDLAQAKRARLMARSRAAAIRRGPAPVGGRRVRRHGEVEKLGDTF